MNRIARRFAALKTQGRAGLVTFVTAGDPDVATSQALLDGLPAAGADLIELGMPFSDPMADGPAIQASSKRALEAGASMATTLQLVRGFRQKDTETPLILMGYYNPIYAMGAQAFCQAAAEAGVDGLIVVDMPPEEVDELRDPAQAQGIDFIFLATPTTDAVRLPTVLAKATGFVYYVSIAGITGTRTAASADVTEAVARLKAQTSLPVAVGFGLKTAEQVAAVAAVADAAVVGSAIVQRLAAHLDRPDRTGLVDDVLGFVRELTAGVREAKR